MSVLLLRPTLAAKETALKIIYRRCAGLDVHEESVFVCARIVQGKKVEVLEATFATFTEDLEALKAWLVVLSIIITFVGELLWLWLLNSSACRDLRVSQAWKGLECGDLSTVSS